MSIEGGTVPSLMAEEPQRGCRVHCDGEGGYIACTGSHGLETRVNATGQGLARSCERGLRHGAVLGVKTNEMVSPTAAVTLVGENAGWLLAPT